MGIPYFVIESVPFSKNCVTFLIFDANRFCRNDRNLLYYLNRSTKDNFCANLLLCTFFACTCASKVFPLNFFTSRIIEARARACVCARARW